MHLAVAIPTYNRVKYLKKNIEFFDTQHIPKDVQLSLVISNSASTDSTNIFLADLQKCRQNLFIFNECLDWVGGNYGYILKTLPKDVDWVWLMGDDDYFVTPNAIENICQIIAENKNNKNFAFIHACDAQRSRKTGLTFKDSTINLCKKFGYIEMLGWFTSLVIRKSEFEKALFEIDQRAQVMRGQDIHKTPYSAFFHSSYFFQHLHEKEGIFFDYPLVSEQIDVDKSKNEHRWQNENMGERYLYIVDDIKRLIDNGLPLKSLPSTFFKYHKYHLWDRFMIYQCEAILEVMQRYNSDLIKSYLPKYWQNWARIESVPPLIDNPELQKSLYISIKNAKAICAAYTDNPLNNYLRTALEETKNLLSVGCYDYYTNYEQTKIFR